jgi:phosphoribosylformylglycinamidine synthase
LPQSAPAADAGLLHATVLIRPKEGILDPQGQAVRDSLRKLGFAVGELHVGRLVEVDVEAESNEDARSRVEDMCRQLLANPLIETYDIRLSPGTSTHPPRAPVPGGQPLEDADPEHAH